MEKLKQREVKHLAQSYTSNKWGTIQVDTVRHHPILPHNDGYFPVRQGKKSNIDIVYKPIRILFL